MEFSLNIPFNTPFIVGKELYYIAKAVLENRQLSGAGPFTWQCQKWLQTRLGSPKALLTHSCTAALEMAAILLDLGPGDEVIMPSFTFVSTANAFVLRGATPVFIDVERRTMNMDASLLETAITPRTKAIVPVHYAGMPCDMNRIMNIAEQNGLFVVEDAAQALLSTHQGRSLGSIGHLGCISFHETKNIISGEGGALLINDIRFADRAEIIWEKGTNRREHFRGQVDKYTWLDIGSSFLPSEIIAAFLFAQFENADVIISKRCKTFHRYMEALSPLRVKGLLGLPPADLSSSCNAHIFYVSTRSLKERSCLIKHLSERDISSVFHYVPLHSSPAGMRFGRIASPMTVTEEMSDRILRLPMFYGIDNSDVDAVVESIYSFYGEKP